MAGLASGKRTLTDVMDHDVAAKRKKREEDSERPVTPARHTPTNTSSKFFGRVASTSKMKRPEAGTHCEPAAGPSRPRLSEGNKENITTQDRDEIDDFFYKKESDFVIQEDGYVSPSPSLTRLDTPDLSSPPRPGTTSSSRSTQYIPDDDDFDVDVFSSPPTIRSKGNSRRTRANLAAALHANDEPAGRVLVRSTPTKPERGKPDIVPGPDLQDIFGDWNDVGDHCDDSADTSMTSAMSSCGPNTPQDARVLREIQVTQGYDEIISDIDEDEESQLRQQKIIDGWRKQYASTVQPRLRPFTVRCVLQSKL